eukprot:gnl/MRDRNA2_/MRDRNA2_126456_c0_seq1.p1 gnl/MRDRNA2_/MRDRNA2_126456_c0~~gnl/MRDRNA2_/MRDRNA2_126456_c0_seq1.p1  ORF type:complete len:693 (-),score=127.67 gnl/MRDRNA2_/MRDRNA2_126456_c0_seq1:252-2246(-)
MAPESSGVHSFDLVTQRIRNEMMIIMLDSVQRAAVVCVDLCMDRFAKQCEACRSRMGNPANCQFFDLSAEQDSEVASEAGQTSEGTSPHVGPASRKGSIQGLLPPVHCDAEKVSSPEMCEWLQTLSQAAALDAERLQQDEIPVHQGLLQAVSLVKPMSPSHSDHEQQAISHQSSLPTLHAADAGSQSQLGILRGEEQSDSRHASISSANISHSETKSTNINLETSAGALPRGSLPSKTDTAVQVKLQALAVAQGQAESIEVHEPSEPCITVACTEAHLDTIQPEVHPAASASGPILAAEDPKPAKFETENVAEVQVPFPSAPEAQPEATVHKASNEYSTDRPHLPIIVGQMINNVVDRINHEKYWSSEQSKKFPAEKSEQDLGSTKAVLSEPVSTTTSSQEEPEDVSQQHACEVSETMDSLQSQQPDYCPTGNHAEILIRDEGVALPDAKREIAWSLFNGYLRRFEERHMGKEAAHSDAKREVALSIVNGSPRRFDDCHHPIHEQHLGTRGAVRELFNGALKRYEDDNINKRDAIQADTGCSACSTAPVQEEDARLQVHGLFNKSLQRVAQKMMTQVEPPLDDAQSKVVRSSQEHLVRELLNGCIKRTVQRHSGLIQSMQKPKVTPSCDEDRSLTRLLMNASLEQVSQEVCPNSSSDVLSSSTS